VTVRRGTTNANVRGNSKDRARRRAKLLRDFGNGWVCPCYRCGVMLDDSTITVDRVNPGCEGGRYLYENCRPACGPCNSSTGALLGSARKKMARHLAA
jgi:5-methylcytosine-specific restriction endonuclease McrA